MSKTRGKSSFRVGDRVRIDVAPHKYSGVIVEDLGPFGGQGRHLFEIEVPNDPFEPMSMFRSEDEMEAIPPGADVVRSIDKERIAEFLVHGGLVSMLWENRMGGKYQPRAWLCLDQLGNVTYTFVPERGVVGGQVVPSGAVRDGKIFKPKREAVRSFVESFGLSPQEAEEVVSEVGTAT